MLELTVISGCQTDGLVSALGMLLPEARVRALRAHTLMGEQRAANVAQLRQADIVFSMPLPVYFEEFTIEAMRASGNTVLCVPQLEFSGLHPDVVYAADKKGWAQSPTSDYHSKIALAAYICGLSPARTVRLFNTYIFEKLDYFKFYERCRQDSISQFASEGIVIDDKFERWERGSLSFMYTSNHPKPFVLADIAIAACKAASLRSEALFPYDFMADFLSSSFLLPVFPEIANRHGFDGHRRYRLAGGPGASVLSLEDYVRESFERYERADIGEWRLTQSTKDAVVKLRDLLSLPRGMARISTDWEAAS